MQPLKDVHSPEFELVLACARWPQEPDDATLIRRLVQRPLQWPRVTAIVQHHQVVSLVSRNLDAFAADGLPQGPGDMLRAAAVENARSCFQRISHLVRLVHLFREEEIELRCFKGIPLAMSAFGDPSLRDAGDIDLLVGEADILNAEKILLGEGYRRIEPGARLSARRMRSYVAHQKDFSYENPRSGAVLDLHWRLFRNRWLPSDRRLEDAGMKWLELGAERIPTLPSDRLFLYLCVHGALDGWLRLKWLADVAALLRPMSPEQLASIAVAAKEEGASAEFSAAVILCERLLGCRAAEALDLDRQDRRVTGIVRRAESLMTSNNCRPVRERIPTTTWFLNEFSLHASWKYRAEMIYRSLFRPRVWEAIDLPDALFPLYALFSPLEWLFFRMRRLANRWTPAKHNPPYSSATAADQEAANQEKKGTPSLLARFLALPFSDSACLIEAGSMLIFFRIALKFLPVHRLTEWMGAAARDVVRDVVLDERDAQTLRRVEWALGAVVRHAPFSFVCFPQALAAYFMLRRRHIASRLFYGIARDDHRLKAHTWIKVGERTIVGGEAESRFTVLAIFP